jgi:hypothetical protein
VDGEWIAFARIVGLELEERRLPIFGWYTSQGQCLDGKGVSPDMEALGRIGIEKAIS